MYPNGCPFLEIYSMPDCWYCTSDNNAWSGEQSAAYVDDDVKQYSLKRRNVKEDTGTNEVQQGRGTPLCVIHHGSGFSAPKTEFTLEEAKRIGEQLGINWNTSKFDVEQFRVGLNTELEHGLRDKATNVTGDDPLLTGKIALAHLNEFPDYYVRLNKLEQEAKSYWSNINK